MDRFRILILNRISPHGLKHLPAEHFVTGGDLGEPDAILVRSADMRDMAIPPSVKAIGRAGAGTNNIPLAEMNRRGVVVFNTPGANANAVKELVLTGMLMAARNIAPAMKFVEGLEGDDATLARLVEEGKKPFAGIELPGRTLGIVGLGAVGGMVADAALKLGMKVLGYDPEITVDAAWRLSAEVRRAPSLEEVFRHSDFITLHVPLLEATRRMVDAGRIALMKHGAVLVNFSREGVVDEAAVLEGLDSRRLRSYVCDFPTARLKAHPGVIALPHLGASTQEAEDNCAVMVAEEVRAFLLDGTIGHSVNFPSVQMPRESPFRIAVANANVPNMLGQISTAMAAAGLNISNMVNKSRGEMAYTLIDTDSEVPEPVVERIRGIDGVLNVRKLPLTEA